MLKINASSRNKSQLNKKYYSYYKRNKQDCTFEVEFKLITFKQIFRENQYCYKCIEI